MAEGDGPGCVHKGGVCAPCQSKRREKVDEREGERGGKGRDTRQDTNASMAHMLITHAHVTQMHSMGMGVGMWRTPEASCRCRVAAQYSADLSRRPMWPMTCAR